MKQSLEGHHQRVPGNYYHQAIRKNFFQRFWHYRRFAEVNNFLLHLNAQNILDVGCHGGRFTVEIAKNIPEASIKGIDISPAAIDFAKKQYPKINFKVGQADKLPYPASCFDLVTCFEVLEHVQNPARVLEEIKRVLKRKGNFLILVPAENFLFKAGWFIWSRLGPGRVWHHTHIQKFQHNALESLFVKTGFKIVKRKQFLLGMLLLIQARKEV